MDSDKKKKMIQPALAALKQQMVDGVCVPRLIRKTKGGKSGHQGIKIQRYKEKVQYVAYLDKQGKRYYGGTYSELDHALEARKRLETIHHEPYQAQLHHAAYVMDLQITEEILYPGVAGLLRLHGFGVEQGKLSADDLLIQGQRVAFTLRLLEQLPTLLMDCLMQQYSSETRTELQTLNYIKMNVLRPLIGQASFNNVNFAKSELAAHALKMHQDYVAPVLRDVQLQQLLEQPDPSAIKEWLYTYQLHVGYRELYKAMKHLDDQATDIPAHIAQAWFPCAMIPGQLGTQIYEEKVNAPFAFSAQGTRNAFWLDGTKQQFPRVSSIAKLLFLLQAVGYRTHHERIQKNTTGKPVYRMMFTHVRASNAEESAKMTLYMHDRYEDRDFIAWLCSQTRHPFQIVVFNHDLDIKATRLEVCWINPKSEWIKSACRIYDHKLRHAFMDQALYGRDPITAIYAALEDNLRSETPSNSLIFAIQARAHFIAERPL